MRKLQVVLAVLTLICALGFFASGNSRMEGMVMILGTIGILLKLLFATPKAKGEAATIGG